jgi:hypothetical protein
MMNFTNLPVASADVVAGFAPVSVAS